MIEIQNNKILLAGKELQFDNKIIEAAEYEGWLNSNSVQIIEERTFIK